MIREKQVIKEDINAKTNKRIGILQFFTNILFIILIGYLFCVQVLDLSGYKAKGIAIRTCSWQLLHSGTKFSSVFVPPFDIGILWCTSIPIVDSHFIHFLPYFSYTFSFK